MSIATFLSLPLSNPSILSHFFSTTLLITLISPSLSLTCTSHQTQSFPNNKTYANCTNLPFLDATLHFTFNSTNSSLSFTFSAPPPPSSSGRDGWISWAINPTSSGMVGAQALMALRTSSHNGLIVAKTFNISSYHSIVESRLSFDVWDLGADEVRGDNTDTLRVFASVKVPEGSKSVNQVWQVGGSLDATNVLPRIHDMTDANKDAKGKLVLAMDVKRGASGGGSAAAAPSPAVAPLPALTNDGSMIGKGNGVHYFMVLSLILLGRSAFSWFYF